jgi:KDO2-lipid IV(A) lauroyltransferase
MLPSAASCVRFATQHEPVFWRCTISSSNASDRSATPATADLERHAPEPRRWTLHGLNNGAIFNATIALVRRLPRRVSHAIGDGCTWLAARLMPITRAALADNLCAARPHASPRALDRLARATLKAYARDTVDFLHALSLDDEQSAALFELPPEYLQRFTDVLAQQRGAILVTGHFGNWEIGSVIMSRVLKLPLSVVAMAEASAAVSQARRTIRDNLGVDTIEVRQSLDTALQIRRRLADNRIVAMLMDRHLGRDRVQVTLLGRPAWFLRTPALMGYLTGAPLMPCFIERSDGDPAFNVFVGHPIVVATDRPRDEAIQRAAQQFADELTQRVRSHPEHWYQFYRYWDAQRDSYEGLA